MRLEDSEKITQPQINYQPTLVNRCCSSFQALFYNPESANGTLCQFCTGIHPDMFSLPTLEGSTLCGLFIQPCSFMFTFSFCAIFNFIFLNPLVSVSYEQMPRHRWCTASSSRHFNRDQPYRSSVPPRVIRHRKSRGRSTGSHCQPMEGRSFIY